MADEAPKSLYEIVGVEKTATTKEITKAFRRKSVKTHPDKFMGDDSHAQKVIEFQELTEAYNELKDPELRKQYDRTGRTGARPLLPSPLCHEPSPDLSARPRHSGGAPGRGGRRRAGGEEEGADRGDQRRRAGLGRAHRRRP